VWDIVKERLKLVVSGYGVAGVDFTVFLLTGKPATAGFSGRPMSTLNIRVWQPDKPPPGSWLLQGVDCVLSPWFGYIDDSRHSRDRKTNTRCVVMLCRGGAVDELNKREGTYTLSVLRDNAHARYQRIYYALDAEEQGKLLAPELVDQAFGADWCWG
jgi:hypothetical protein